MKNKSINNIGAIKFGTALIIVGFFIFLTSVSHVFAQTDEFKRVEISAGYSRTQTPDLINFSQTLILMPNPANGWMAGGAFKIRRWVAVYAEGGQDYGKLGEDFFTTRSTRTSILGGVRFYIVNRSRLTPFLNTGVGNVRLRAESRFSDGVHSKTPTHSGLLFTGGGGVDVAINKKKSVSWRTGVEYRRGLAADDVALFSVNGKSTGNIFRFSTGIAINF